MGGETKTVNAEGIIELHDGETATILMMADSTYEVQEVNLDTALYTFVSYQKNSDPVVQDQNTGVSGTIEEPQQEDTVVVTNKTVEPEEDTNLDKKPDYQKKAEDDDDDGVYDLSLSVSGTAARDDTKEQPINVLFVVDISSSMRDYFEGYDDRMDGANQAMSILTSSLSEANGYDARFAMVTFHGPATYAQEWTTDASQIYATATYDYGYPTSQGTNYQAGIKKAKEAIADLQRIGRDEIPTAVIFISDGEPNQYYLSEDHPNYPYDRYGNSIDSVTALNHAQEELNSLSGIQYFYTVGVGSENNYQSLQNFKANEAYGIQNGYFPGNNKKELEGAFEKIAQEITYTAFSNVTINDELSDYVEVAVDQNNNPTGFQIAVKDPEKEEAYTSTGIEQVSEGIYTAELTLAATEMNNFQATLTATYDSANGTLTLDFPNEYKLENQWTYEVHIHNQPNDKAEAAYIDAGYTYPTADLTGSTYLPNPPAGEADANTGTYAEEVGFYSNKSATFVYTAQNGKRYKGEYKKPVVQLDTTPVTITKTFDGLDDVSQIPDGFKIMVNNKELPLPTENSTFTSSWSLNLLDGPNTVTERNYVAAEETNKLLQDVTVSGLVGGKPTASETGNPITLGTLTLDDSSHATVAVQITNTYADANIQLTIQKELEGERSPYGKAVFDFEILDQNTGEVRYVHLDLTENDTASQTIIVAANHIYQIRELSNMNYKQDGGIEWSPETPEWVDNSGNARAIEWTGWKLTKDVTATFTNKANPTNIPTDGSAAENTLKQQGDQYILYFKERKLGADAQPVEGE